MSVLAPAPPTSAPASIRLDGNALGVPPIPASAVKPVFFDVYTGPDHRHNARIRQRHYFDDYYIWGTLHVRLAQLTPNAVVVSIVPENAAVPGHPEVPTMFNLSIVAEKEISLTELISAPAETPLLTRQQRRLLTLRARGETQKRCAEVLGITVNTSEGYMKAALSRLHAKNTEEAVAIAISYGLVPKRRRDPITREKDTSHSDLLAPEFRLSPSHNVPRGIHAPLDLRTNALKARLSPYGRYIEIGRGDDMRVIAIRTEGPVHISQIRRSMLTLNAKRKRPGLPASSHAVANGGKVGHAGISERTLRRSLEGRLASPHYTDKIPAKTVAAQMGWCGTTADVHLAAREWLYHNVYAENMQDEPNAMPDALSPIFMTSDS